MDEDSKVEPMSHVGETVQELIERLSGETQADDPCPVCLGTGTELISSENGLTFSRVCRHIG